MIISPAAIQAPPAQIIVLSDNEFKNTIKNIVLCEEENTQNIFEQSDPVSKYLLPFSKLMPLEDKPIYSDFPSIISNHA